MRMSNYFTPRRLAWLVAAGLLALALGIVVGTALAGATARAGSEVAR